MNYIIYKLDLNSGQATVFKELRGFTEYDAVKHTARAVRFVKKHDFDYAYFYREIPESFVDSLNIPVL